jgi:tetratricopeptide (TPR) repeat protein
VGDEPISRLMDIVENEFGKRAYIALVVLLVVASLIFALVAHPDIVEAVMAAACCVPIWLWYVWVSYRKKTSRDLGRLILALAILSTGGWAVWWALTLTSTGAEIARDLNAGQDAMRDKNYSSAEKHFEDARDRAKSSKSHTDDQVKSLFLLGETEIMSGQGSPEQIKKAQDNFGSAFDLASGNPNMKARVRIAQAEITSDNDEARQYLSEALDFSRKMEEHDSYLEATILRAQGDLENSLLNRDQAITDYRDATEAYRKGDDGARSWRTILFGWIHAGPRKLENWEGEATVLLSLGNLELNVGNLKDPRSHYAQAAQLFLDVHQPREEVYAYLGLGDVDRAVNHFEDARKNYRTADGLFYNDQHGRASVSLSLAGLEASLGNTDSALRDYKTASGLFGVDPLDQRDVLVGRAQLETSLGNYDDARNDLKAASDLFGEGDDPLGQAMIWEAMGHLDTELGKDKKREARESYEKARTVYARNTDLLGEADVSLGFGRWESKFGDPKVAYKDLEDAFELYRKEEIPFGQADVLYNRAGLERGEKKYDLAGADYAAARKIYEQESQDVCKVGVANVLLDLGELAGAQGHNEEALADDEQALGMYEEQKSLIGQANVDFAEGLPPRQKPGEAVGRLNKAKALYSQMGISDKPGEVQQQLNKHRGLAASK